MAGADGSVGAHVADEVLRVALSPVVHDILPAEDNTRIPPTRNEWNVPNALVLSSLQRPNLKSSAADGSQARDSPNTESYS
jgi:hypothetical protein